MRKADREKFYSLVDEMKFLIDSNKIMSQKDINTIINELITLKLRLQDKNKAFSQSEKEIINEKNHKRQII